jgi:hypothetical protein
VTGAETSVDPFLVIYEINPGSVYGYQTQQHLDVLGYNDDYSGLNPQVSIGPFDAPKYVYVLAFAYDIYSKGQANITIQTGGSTETRTDVWMKGNAIFHDNDHGQEIDKSGNMVNLQDEGWGSYLPGTTVFTVADYNYWTGDYNWGAYVPLCTGDSYIWAFNLSGMRGMANDDSPGGLCSSVWNDASWTPFPSGYHYPNFVLIGGYSDGGTANFLQISAFQR